MELRLEDTDPLIWYEAVLPWRREFWALRSVCVACYHPCSLPDYFEVSRFVFAAPLAVTAISQKLVWTYSYITRLSGSYLAPTVSLKVLSLLFFCRE